MEKINRCFIYLTFFYSCSIAVAQDQVVDYGVLGKSTFDIHIEDEDGVVIFDQGVSSFMDYDGWYRLQFKRHKRIKIITEAGLSQASIEIPLYTDGKDVEIVSEIRASSYIFENGKMTETSLDKSNIYDEIINERWSVKKFIIPNVQVGSVIEFEYELISPFFFNLPDWTFQSNIPTMYSSYTVGMIPFYDYVVLQSGDIVNLKQDSYVSKGFERNYRSLTFKDKMFSYTGTDLPAFDDEQFISSRKDFMTKIDFQMSKFNSPDGGSTEIISTWEQLVKDLLKDDRFGYYIEKAEKKAKDVFKDNPELLEGDAIAKTTKIINFIKKSITSNKFYALFAQTKPRDVFKEGVGSSAEINLILVAFLKVGGIDAKPIILSTRENGKIFADYPLLDYFNKTAVLVQIGEAGFITDASNPDTPINLLPTQSINGAGLIVDKDFNWIPLLKDIESLKKTIVSQNVSTSGDSINGMIVQLVSGYNGETNRAKYKNDPIKTLSSEYQNKPFAKLSKTEIKNSEKLESPLTIIVAGDIAASKIMEEIIISPFLNQALEKNPLSKKERTYPIDFNFVKTYEYNSKIKFPENYVVEFLPNSIKETNSIYELTYEVSELEGEIKINARYVFVKSVYEPKDYQAVKAGFDKIVSTLNQDVLLKKI